MSKNSIEIEVKILLQSEENKKKFISKLEEKGALVEKHRNTQLNHYFEGGSLVNLKENIGKYLTTEESDRFNDLIGRAKTFSARTRQADDEVIFVVKASIDETNSINGTGRIEFEVTLDMSIEDMDKIFLESGFTYDSKWSRSRIEYSFGEYTICIDKNAGWGILSEIEKVVTDESQLDKVKLEIRELISELGFEPLPEERAIRMHAHYKNVWPYYYGTQHWFNVL